MVEKSRVLSWALLSLVFIGFPPRISPQEQAGYWASKPSAGHLMIIGVSNPQRRRDTEIENARDDAARKIALYHGLKGSVTTISAGGPGLADFYTAVTVEPDTSSGGDYRQYRDALIFGGEQDVTRYSGAVFVRFTYPAPELEGVGYEAVWVNGEPSWIHHPPERLEREGFITGVGFSGPQRYLKDTVNKSCENAAAGLLARSFTQVKALDRDSPARGTYSYIRESAEGRLTGFMALEIWIDPKTKAVWTLAAAKKI